MPNGLLPAILVLFFVLAAVQGFLWWLISCPYQAGTFPAWLSGWNHVIELFCLLLVPISISGFVLAQRNDYHWRALYVLGLTAIVLTLILLKPLTSLDLTYANPAELAPSYYISWIISAVFGLVWFWRSLS